MNERKYVQPTVLYTHYKKRVMVQDTIQTHVINIINKVIFISIH